MRIITYESLRKKLKELDYQGFNKSLEEITGRGNTYISEIAQGKRNFKDKQEMDLVLEAIGEKKTSENYLKYFPTLGISQEETIKEQAVILLRNLFKEAQQDG